MSIELRRHFEKITPLTDQEFDYILSHFTTKKLKNIIPCQFHKCHSADPIDYGKTELNLF